MSLDDTDDIFSISRVESKIQSVSPEKFLYLIFLEYRNKQIAPYRILGGDSWGSGRMFLIFRMKSFKNSPEAATGRTRNRAFCVRHTGPFHPSARPGPPASVRGTPLGEEAFSRIPPLCNVRALRSYTASLIRVAPTKTRKHLTVTSPKDANDPPAAPIRVSMDRARDRRFYCRPGCRRR